MDEQTSRSTQVDDAQRDRLQNGRAEEIARILRLRIQSGELIAGDRLPPERRLAHEFAVARPTLREALKILNVEGFLRTRQGASGGSFVSGLERPLQEWIRNMRANPDQLNDIVDFRLVLEKGAAALASERRQPEDLSLLHQAVEDLSTCTSQVLYRQADTRFHNGVAVAARSPKLLRAIREIRGELFTPIDLVDDHLDIDGTKAEHSSILAAIRVGNGKKAALEMEAHIEKTRTEIQRIIGSIGLII